MRYTAKPTDTIQNLMQLMKSDKTKQRAFWIGKERAEIRLSVNKRINGGKK